MNSTKPASHEVCVRCGRYNNRGLGADAIIISQNKVLLGKRLSDPFRGYWALFGGYVEWDESVEEAMKREVKEESDLNVLNYKLVGIYSQPSRHPKQAITVVYDVEVEGEPAAGDDICEVKWFSLNDLPEMAFDHKNILIDYLKQQ